MIRLRPVTIRTMPIHSSGRTFYPVPSREWYVAEAQARRDHQNRKNAAALATKRANRAARAGKYGPAP